MEELQRTQHFNPQGNDEVELNQNGKRPALFDEMQELLDTRKENPASADSSMLRLCRYSKYGMNVVIPVNDNLNYLISSNIKFKYSKLENNVASSKQP